MNKKQPYSKRYDRWEGYYLEDCDCIYCLYFKGKKGGCPRKSCCCEEEKLDAIKHGRIKRKRGWDICPE